MRPRLRRAAVFAYRVSCRPPGSEEVVEVEPGVTVRRFVLEWSRSGPAYARAFLDRVPEVRLAGRSVLALGRGAADLGVEAGRRQARRVVAVEKVPERLELTATRLREEGDDLPVELWHYTGGLDDLGEQRFDVVLAMDALWRALVDPPGWHVGMLLEDIAEHLETGGLLAIRWGPAWKSPYGGKTDSRLPWDHLLLPEDLIFEEFRRVRPGNELRSFPDKLTMAEFRRRMDGLGLEPVRFDTNASGRKAARVVRALGRLPGLEEYLTQNVHGVWRRP
jgi:hypothetical protein